MGLLFVCVGGRHRLHLLVAIVISFVVVQDLIKMTHCLSEATQLIPPSEAHFPIGATPSLCPLVPACSCKWTNGKQSASCNNKGINTIPSQLPGDTQILEMSGSNLNQLQQHIFQNTRLTNLQKLFLSKAKISFIADEAFEQLTNLVELDLSYNYIQQVPTKALEPLKYSLRKLSLAHNQIHVVESSAFSQLNRLNTLDLSNCQMTQLKPNAFYGLTDLHELKLNENYLTQLPMNVISDLKEYIILDLYGNPWQCDCELRQSIEWINRHHVQQSLIPSCATPQRHKDIRWHNVKPEDFICPPVIINKQNELIVGAGSNVTLACTARGSPPLTFVWFQDEKNLTTGRGSSNSGPNESLPSTRLLEERRYEIAEEPGPPNITTSILYLMNLKLTDTSLFLCWVENAAGYTIGNFSLIVNDGPPANHPGIMTSPSDGANDGPLGWMRWFTLGGEYPSTQTTIIYIALLSFLVLAIICLLATKRLAMGRSSKSSSQSNLKPHHHNHHTSSGMGKLSAAHKFSHTNGTQGKMFASSDDDVATDDDDGNSTGASSSTVSTSNSCKKGKKVMAVDDLDGFIEHMRSGIINMDYHSMSPVIQFNSMTMKNTSTDPSSRQQQPQMAHLNHFPSSSNSSSQPPCYSVNGSNSMATTLSDLSPSSGGSASTSFVINSNPMTQQQQHKFSANPNQYGVSNNNNNGNNGNAIHGQQLQSTPITNCDFQAQHQLGGVVLSDMAQGTNTTSTSYTSDYQSGYSQNDEHQQQQQLHHLQAAHMISPMYGAAGFDPAYQQQQQQQQAMYQHQTLVAGQQQRPASMNARDPRNIVLHNLVQPDGRLHPTNHQQQQQYHPSNGFHIL